MSVKFSGSSIIQFNCSVGFNDEVSRLNVTLVDDDTDDDNFSPPEVGHPVYFNFEGWKFNGLLERYTRSFSFSGNPIYEATVVDPRELLTGVQVILSDYYGSVYSVPNVINVFGYLENTLGFGGSGGNSSGIPYQLVIGTINTMANTLINNLYGGKIAYKGIAYGIDLTNLPFISSAFRVGGVTSMSLMEILGTICEAGACEMFFTLEYEDGINIIKLHTISRANVPSIGTINQFVSTTEGATSKDVGMAMVNDTCAKMVFGGKQENLYYQFLSGGEDDDIDTGYDNTIQPFWGWDLDGNIVLGNYTGYAHQFVLDTRNIQLSNVGRTYPTDVGEMIAILNGYSNWVSYIWLYTLNRYVIDGSGNQTDKFYTVTSNKGGKLVVQQNGASYNHNGVFNPHFMKGYNLRLSPILNMNLANVLFSNTVQGLLTKSSMSYINPVPGDIVGVVQELYDYLHDFADTFYGKQYMVRTPNVYVKYDPDTFQFSSSMLPVSSAYMEVYDVETSQNYKLLPLDIIGITDQQNKVECFVRYDNIGLYNFANIPSDSLFYSSDGNSLFIKCTVGENFVFLDNATFSSPRVVVTLPGIVGINSGLTSYYGILDIFLLRLNGANGITRLDLDELQNKFLKNAFIGLTYLDSKVPLAVTPHVAAIPLQSQIDLYGPWYIATSVGKTVVEYDDTLVPWNYGSMAIMNIAGQAKVSEIGVRLQTLEDGSVEYPGVPLLSLGDQLLSTGPYVTNIQVGVGVGGITTRYSMKSWSPQFGKLAKYMVDRTMTMQKAQVGLTRYIREVERRKLK